MDVVSRQHDWLHSRGKPTYWDFPSVVQLDFQAAHNPAHNLKRPNLWKIMHLHDNLRLYRKGTIENKRHPAAGNINDLRHLRR